MKKILFIHLVFVLVLSSCNKDKKQTEDILISDIKESNQQKEPEQKIIIPHNVDLDFKNFISYFNKSSEFQLSRVKFPLKAEVLDSDYEKIEILIVKKYYQVNDFNLEQNLEYNLEIIEKKDKAFIEIRGIDNGIMIDYVFEKIKGKWLLTEITDLST